MSAVERRTYFCPYPVVNTVRHAQLTDAASIQRRMRALLRRTPHTHSSTSEVGLHPVPVVDAQRKLVGMVTQTDLTLQ